MGEEEPIDQGSVDKTLSGCNHEGVPSTVLEIPDHARKLDNMMSGMDTMVLRMIEAFQERLIAESTRRAAMDAQVSEPETLSPTYPAPEAVVFHASFSSLRDAIVDISPSATPYRFRFIDCASFVREQTLRIVEYSDISEIPYAAVSYIWRGIIGPPIAAMSQFGTFGVEGAMDGDLISIGVLVHACTAALDQDAPYLWLDRLCIMQNSHEDKAWQIKNMYKLYSSCKECFILPGGTRRLASLEEPTMWIHRGWTLQEAVAPKSARVLFAWELEGGAFGNPKKPLGTSGSIQEVIPGQSATSQLRSLVKASVADGVRFRVVGGRPVNATIGIFGNQSTAGRRHASALAAALTLPGTDDPTMERKGTALWRSAHMRTSSRPVDMVFSIMGLFDVTLDPRAFQADDRLGATIALAMEILSKGGSPSWLAISLSVPPHQFLSSFPQFPKTNEAGGAVLQTDSGLREIADLMDDTDGWLSMKILPGAAMDASGYLAITTVAAPVTLTEQRREKISVQKEEYDSQLLLYHNMHSHPFLVARDGAVWETLPWQGDSESGRAPEAFVLSLGRMRTMSNSRIFDSQSLIKAIMVVEHAPGKFHRSSSWFIFNFLSYQFPGWEEHTFHVGGPISASE